MKNTPEALLIRNEFINKLDTCPDINYNCDNLHNSSVTAEVPSGTYFCSVDFYKGALNFKDHDIHCWPHNAITVFEWFRHQYMGDNAMKSKSERLDNQLREDARKLVQDKIKKDTNDERNAKADKLLKTLDKAMGIKPKAEEASNTQKSSSDK